MAIIILKFRKMKKFLMYISLAILLVSCQNGEIKYPDYTYQTVYFPVQYPVRNLVLGESRYDTSIDREHAFTIAVNVGGIYDFNAKDRIVYIKYAPELVSKSFKTGNDTTLFTDLADTLRVLPASYCKQDLTTIDRIVIPKGSFDGRIRIELTDAFFNDPKAIGIKYVLPFVILPTTEDSVLSGVRADGLLTMPNRLVAANWKTGFTPMDYTLFGIKYSNKYHGNYFHYGVENLYKADVFFSTKKYSTAFVEDNTVTLVKTASLTESTIDRLGGTNIGVKYTVKMKINDDKTISLTSVPSLPLNDHVVVTGSGRLLEDSERVKWGGKANPTIVLNYKFTDANGEHRCNDTLVYRTNAIVYQEFKVKQ
jgi:hypothetical protein